jgi:hypothetical protein
MSGGMINNNFIFQIFNADNNNPAPKKDGDAS